VTKLDVLLQKIDPDGLDMHKMASRVDRALDGFHVKWAQVQNRDDFRECIAAFVFRVKVSPVASLWLAGTAQIHWWESGSGLLAEAYGPNGADRAYYLAAGGDNGGIHGVLRKLGTAILRHDTEAHVGRCIRDYWEQLSVVERLNAPEEYLAKWGGILPLSLRGRHGPPIGARFPEILTKHPDWLRSMRSGLRPAT